MSHGRSLAGRSVLLTGGYGVLGGHLAEALLAVGARVVLLRRDRVPGTRIATAGLEARCAVVDGDLTEPGLLERTIGEHEVEVVFHLAAQTIVGTANRSPLSTFETNVRGTWLLMEACRLQGVAGVVVASSDKAYGSHAELPYREEHELRARHPYDVSKAATELVARSYWHTYGVPTAVTRLANVYGGGDLNRSRLVPEAVAAVLAGRSPVIRSDGSPERDYLHASDAAAAYLAVADLLAAGTAGGEAFNAGTGQPRSVLDVVSTVCRVAGTELEPDVRGAGVPAGEIDRQWVDAAKLRAASGWTPRVDLEAGLADTLAWYREHGTA